MKLNRTVKFFIYLLITVGLTYFTPRTVSSIWYIILLTLYYRSSDEPFWLAFFITISDGFIGFFSAYATVITLIPGLPGIDMPQIYILLSLYKIYIRKIKVTHYYGSWTKVLMAYTILLIVVGIMNGISGGMNVYFRVVKLTLPLLLIYTVPRLMISIEDYKKLFDLLFIVFITGFAAQIFNVFTGFSPANNFKLPEHNEELEERGENLRSFYNCVITLMSLLASIFFLSIKNEKHFPKTYLYLIIGMTFFMAFLSATRGWIICIGVVIALFFIIIQKGKNLGRVALLFLLLVAVGMSNKKIRDRTYFALERFMTLEALAGGDETAGGTLARLNERGPVVLAAWADNPIFGWGYSNVYFEKNDGHVGNHNILLHSGVIGFTLLMIFILFVNITMYTVYKSFASKSKYKDTPLVFIVFFMGYFIIHSSSGQQFGYMGYPQNVFMQAVFLGMSSIMYRLSQPKRISFNHNGNGLLATDSLKE